MVLAGEKLILAGPPDTHDPHKALRAIEGESGALMWVVDRTTGEKLAEHHLEQCPRYDAMAIAMGRCYYSAIGGQLVCLGQ